MGFVPKVGNSINCLFRRILYTARTLHEVSEALISVLNPFFWNVSIKICGVASSCGAMIVGDTKALTLARFEKRKDGWRDGRSPVADSASYSTSIRKAHKP